MWSILISGLNIDLETNYDSRWLSNDLDCAPTMGSLGYCLRLSDPSGIPFYVHYDAPVYPLIYKKRELQLWLQFKPSVQIRLKCWTECWPGYYWYLFFYFPAWIMDRYKRETYAKTPFIFLGLFSIHLCDSRVCEILGFMELGEE